MGSLILRAASGLLCSLLGLLSVYMLVRGHDAPGGGFVGGLLLAAALAVQSIAHGPAATRATLRVDPRTLAGIGLGLVAIAACAGFALGETLLYPLWAGVVPAAGHVGTVLLFDIGVYLTVAGTALAIVLTLAEEEL